MKSRRILVLVLAIPAALLVWVTAAVPYTLEHDGGYLRWPSNAAVVMNYNLTFPPPSAAMQAPMVQSVIHHVLIDEWNAVLGGMPLSLHFVDGGTTNVSTTACDGINVITFSDTTSPFSPGVLAYTVYSVAPSPFTYPAGTCGPNPFTTTLNNQLIDTDIIFNPAYAFTAVGLNSTLGGAVSATVPGDLEGTLLHEAGHVLGLHHSGIVSARMVAASDQFYGIHTLSTDDIAGINAAYGTNVPGGSVLGKVVDHSGLPVVSAHVVLTDAVSGLVVVSALTQPDGTYQIVGVPGSSYTAYVEPMDGPEYISNISGDLQPGSSYVTNGAASFITSFYSSTLNVIAGHPVTGINFTVTNPETGNLLSMIVAQKIQDGSTSQTPGNHVSAARGPNVALGWVGNGLTGDTITSVPPQYMAALTSTSGSSSQLVRGFSISASTPIGAYNLYSGTPPNLALTGAFLISPNAVVPTGGIVDGAAFSRVPNTTNHIAQGSIISIFGSDLAAAIVPNYVFPVPTQLGGVTVKIGNRFAPLFFVSPGQINAMVPYEVSGTVDVQVVTGYNTFYDCGNISVSSSAPRIFVAGAQTSSGSGVGAIQNGSHNNVPVSSNLPAVAGDVLVVYLEGLGPTNPPTITGLGGSTGIVSGVTATMGGMPAFVNYAGVSPGFSGLYQVNITVPGGLGTGDVNLVITDSKGNQTNVVTVAVH